MYFSQMSRLNLIKLVIKKTLMVLSLVTSLQIFATNLPNTDGSGLATKLPALTAEQRSRLNDAPQNCEEKCVAPFGNKLGVADGVIAYSNCQSSCEDFKFSFLNLISGEITHHSDDPKDKNLHYIGLVHQCVEYARKWWMINKGITFESIDSAFEIIYLTEGKDIRSKVKFPLARSINGTASRPPKRGDLVIYSADRANPDWLHGHVAVVVDVDLNKGEVSLAEENYNNLPWKDAEKYARKIRLFSVSGQYTLIDVDSDSVTNSTGAKISGWIYPLAEEAADSSAKSSMSSLIKKSSSN